MPQPRGHPRSTTPTTRGRHPGIVGTVTKRHTGETIKRRLAHLAPTSRKFKSQGQEQRFRHREKRAEISLGPTAKAHRRFKLYGESKSPFRMLLRLLEDDKTGLDPKEVRKAARQKYQDDIKSGKVDLPQRIARVWSKTSKRGKVKVSSRLLAAYRKLTGG